MAHPEKTKNANYSVNDTLEKIRFVYGCVEVYAPQLNEILEIFAIEIGNLNKEIARLTKLNPDPE